MPAERFIVRSKDGVGISVQKLGSGPALLLVHGALLNGTLSWGAVMPKLAERFTLYVMDRRGRAPSGDAEAYSIANESDDVVNVVAAIGRPVTILAHSYGALVMLDALDRLRHVTHLILYEPPVTAKGARPDSEAVLEKLDNALAAGNREEVAITFLRDQVKAPPEALQRFQSSPIWPLILQIASTLPRESRAVNTYRPFIERLANWKFPATVLLGSESQGLLRDAAYFVRDHIPGSQLVILEGQGHGAMLDAPDWFAGKVIELAG
jgi:pimeloyl-ACP methyl ester carboxylesterase